MHNHHRMANNNNQTSDHNIDVVIVEPHQHVLEHIHHVMRRSYRKRKIKGPSSTTKQPWTMIHFDSHPDLACPNDSIPATLCFTPRRRMASVGRRKEESFENNVNTENGEGKDLYEFLDTSQSGIAEWIIPLVFSGDMKRLCWIKNEWCHQFESGRYKFNVGAWIPPSRQQCDTTSNTATTTATTTGQSPNPISSAPFLSEKIECFIDLPENAPVKTSFCHHYYLDDNCVVLDQELHMKQQLDYIVVDLRRDIHVTGSFITPSSPKLPPVESSTYESNLDGDWILDVCLDYFICYNPFVVDLEATDKVLTQVLVQAVNELKSRKMVETLSSSSSSSYFGFEKGSEYLAISKQFHELASTFFKSVSSKNEWSIHQSHHFLDEEQYSTLYSLYPHPLIGKQIWDSLSETMIRYANEKSIDEVKTLCCMILNALPSITLPHQAKHSLLENHNGETLTLSSEILSAVKMFGEDLRHQRWEKYWKLYEDEEDGGRLKARPPSLVTIARSSEDGFTPQNVVDMLQEAVLDEVRHAYSDYTINVVLDYGEYEGSTLN